MDICEHFSKLPFLQCSISQLSYSFPVALGPRMQRTYSLTRKKMRLQLFSMTGGHLLWRKVMCFIVYT